MSIIATVIGGVILALKKILRKRLSPNAHYVIWLVFLVALIFPVAVPSGVSIYNYVDISNVKEVKNSESQDVLNLLKREDDNDLSQKDLKNNIYRNNKSIWMNCVKRIIAFGWLIVFLVKLSKRMFSYYAMGKLAGNAEAEEERVVALFEACKKRLKIRRKIKLITQDCTDMPCTMGVFNVKILVPYSFLELDDIMITNILMHELSHYKRKDNVVNFAILVLKSLHWFNPAMGMMFENIREEMELATDEVAVSPMSFLEKAEYCKSMVMFSASSEADLEEVLGMSNTAQTLEKRISNVFLRENFEKNSKIILGATILITILMCLVLYPTSYGIFETPRLYLELENGDKVEATKIDGNATINEIKLMQNDNVSLVVKGGKPNDYIFYSKTNSDTMEFSEETVNISNGKMSYFENGEAIYKFTLTYANNKTVDYAIKIIVE